ncbi:MAG: hypothetical protein CFE23_04300 [Flavobacterium sp. BFFFF1]|nr:MAG: hypothetical protein CFE23_04300 [Flavobacterium sp. BFFFF1]
MVLIPSLFGLGIKKKATGISKNNNSFLIPETEELKSKVQNNDNIIKTYSKTGSSNSPDRRRFSFRTDNNVEASSNIQLIDPYAKFKGMVIRLVARAIVIISYFSIKYLILKYFSFKKFVLNFIIIAVGGCNTSP